MEVNLVNIGKERFTILKPRGTPAAVAALRHLPSFSNLFSPSTCPT